MAVQTPQYRMDSLDALMRTPISAPLGGVLSTTATSLAGTAGASNSAVGAAPSQSSLAYGNPGAAAGGPQLLSNLATVERGVAPEIVNHYNVQPVFDVYANVDRQDLGSVGTAVREDHARSSRQAAARHQLRPARAGAHHGDFLLPPGHGLIFAIVLVYLLMAVNFQSWLDPFIILMALPGALAGIVWMLFITQTTFSVPSLMGAIMCIGVATANSILMVVFANDQRLEGMDARSAALSAGHTRIRPVLMTALAMIIGMLPMALGTGRRRRAECAAGPRRDRRPAAGHGHHAVRGSDRLQLAEEEAAGRFRPEDRRGRAGGHRRRTAVRLMNGLQT